MIWFHVDPFLIFALDSPKFSKLVDTYSSNNNSKFAKCCSHNNIYSDLRFHLSFPKNVAVVNENLGDDQIMNYSV